MREQQNVPTVRPAYTMVGQATCPIPLGSVGLWFELATATLKFRLASGADSIIVGLAGFPGTPTFTSNGIGGPIRPAPSAVGASLTSAVWIYNSGPGGTGPKVPEYSDGVEWRDVEGSVTT